MRKRLVIAVFCLILPIAAFAIDDPQPSCENCQGTYDPSVGLMSLECAAARDGEMGTSDCSVTATRTGDMYEAECHGNHFCMTITVSPGGEDEGRR
jgi:hypothetical protein